MLGIERPVQVSKPLRFGFAKIQHMRALENAREGKVLEKVRNSQWCR